MRFILLPVLFVVNFTYSSGQGVITKQLPEVSIKDSAVILTITYNKLKYISIHAQYRPLQTYAYEQTQVSNGQLKDSSVEYILSSKNRPTSAIDFNEMRSERFCNPRLQHLLQYSFAIGETIEHPKTLERIAKNWNKYQKSIQPTKSSDLTIKLTHSKGDTISVILDSITFNIKKIETTFRTRSRGHVKNLNSNQEVNAHRIISASFSYEGSQVFIENITRLIQAEFYDSETDRVYPHHLTAKLELCKCDKTLKSLQELKSIRRHIPCSAYLLN